MADEFMKNILSDDDFIIILQGKRGTHRTRKIAMTKARMCRCSKDESDTREHWQHRRHQDSCADTILPCPDAKVAATLCKGGSIHYQVRVDIVISEDWISTLVVPTIASKLVRR